MTREQADKEAQKIFQEVTRKCDAITEQAKKDGTWKPGLDSNNDLFKQVHDEAKEKLRILASMIDE